MLSMEYCGYGEGIAGCFPVTHLRGMKRMPPLLQIASRDPTDRIRKRHRNIRDAQPPRSIGIHRTLKGRSHDRR